MRRFLMFFLSLVMLTPMLIGGPAFAQQEAHHKSGGQRLFIVFFKPWSADLGKTSLKVVQDAAAAAKAIPLSHVTVLGYADTEGSAKANLDLTQQRVRVVREALVRAGYPKDDISVKAEGSVAPIGDAQESRRVEITIRAP
jgi:outer membrane protein OmpA-like peptidoglycan-associated protein